MQSHFTDSATLLSAISRRRSLRSYDPAKTLNDVQWLLLFEAASKAPSAFNEQPWVFLYANRGTEAFQKLWSSLAPSNQEWAAHASGLILVMAKTHLERNQQFNRHALHDVGAAMAFLSLQATEMGLNIHQMGGFFPEKVTDLFVIPPQHELVSISAIGYPDEPTKLPEAYLARELTPSGRKSIHEFAFANELKM